MSAPIVRWVQHDTDVEKDMRRKSARDRSAKAFPPPLARDSCELRRGSPKRLWREGGALHQPAFALLGAACLVASATLAARAGATGQSDRADGRVVVVLDNARVRVFKTTGASLAGVAHRTGVAVPLEDGPTRNKGDAYWAAEKESAGTDPGPIVFVEPKPFTAAAPPSQTGAKPGDAPFVGMSFKTLFENATVTAIRARMDVGAREGLHTHASDTIVVHLSGGAIADTANGTTSMNRWKPGDVEFESRGSSHSARNVGQAVDVVLVVLRP
jgi:quercetin dioxygenase-like cupin family protein